MILLWLIWIAVIARILFMHYERRVKTGIDPWIAGMRLDRGDKAAG